MTRKKKIFRRKYRQKRQGKPAYAIIIEGETEYWYFQKLKEHERKLIVNIKPTIPKGKKLSELFEKVIEEAKRDELTKVFWIIDLDKVIRDRKVEELRKYLSMLESKEYSNVITILNNPCLEFWFLLHFQKTTKYYQRCHKAIDELKKHLADYSKNKKYFTKKNNDIYLRLKPHLEKALKNTRKTQRKGLNNLQQAICEMNLFFETGQIGEIIFGEK